MHVRAARDHTDRGGKAATGRLPTCTLGVKLGAGDRLAAVFRGGPAARAGLSAGDTLVAIDGIRFTPELLQARLLHATPGERVAVHAFRRDELAIFDVSLAEAPPEVCYLVPDADASPVARARRDAWLADDA